MRERGPGQGAWYPSSAPHVDNMISLKVSKALAKSTYSSTYSNAHKACTRIRKLVGQQPHSLPLGYTTGDTLKIQANTRTKYFEKVSCSVGYTNTFMQQRQKHVTILQLRAALRRYKFLTRGSGEKAYTKMQRLHAHLKQYSTYGTKYRFQGVFQILERRP